MLEPEVGSIDKSLYVMGSRVISLFLESSLMPVDVIYNRYCERFGYVAPSRLELSLCWLYLVGFCSLTDEGDIQCNL